MSVARRLVLGVLVLGLGTPALVTAQAITASGACPIAGGPFALNPGVLCFRTDTSVLAVWNGSAWIAVPAVGVPVTPAGGGTGTVTAFTLGSVVVAGAAGVYTQANANLFWDATNLRLGIGTAAPAVPLEIKGDAANWTALALNRNNASAAKSVIVWQQQGTGLWQLGSSPDDNTTQGFFLYDTVAGARRLLVDASGNFTIGVTAAGTSAGLNLGLSLGTAPTSSPASFTALWADNVGGANTAGLFIRDESGGVFKIGQGKIQVPVGTSTALATASGATDVQTGSVCTAANTTETTLYTLTLPASALAVNGQGITLEASGTLAATATTKRIRLYFGATVIADSNATTTNNGSFYTWARVIRTSATAQEAIGTGFQDAATTSLGTDNTVLRSAPGETLSGTVIVKATGQNGTANANDICGKLMVTEYKGF